MICYKISNTLIDILANTNVYNHMLIKTYKVLILPQISHRPIISRYLLIVFISVFINL